MYSALFRHFGVFLLTGLLLLNLTGCEERKTQDIWNAGHAAGYMDGLADAEQAAALPILPAAKIGEKPMNAAAEADFVSLSRFIPDAIVELRYATTYNFVGERMPGYEQPVALLSREAAEALREVSDELVAKGYRLKIYDTYRPQQATDRFGKWAMDLDDQKMKPYFYPDEEKATLIDKGYIANRSAHSRGSCVDLTLLDMSTGQNVDMGGNFDFFGPCSHRDYHGLTPEQRANRRLLRETMEAHGFKSIPAEWWHFMLKNEPNPDTYFNFPLQDPEN